MVLKDIRAIIDLMKKNDLAVFKLEKEGFRLELEAHRPPAPLVCALPGHQLVTGAPIGGYTTPAQSPPAVVPVEGHPDSKEIVSPMVGTFYRAPSPDSAPCTYRVAPRANGLCERPSPPSQDRLGWGRAFRFPR